MREIGTGRLLAPRSSRQICVMVTGKAEQAALSEAEATGCVRMDKLSCLSRSRTCSKRKWAVRL